MLDNKVSVVQGILITLHMHLTHQGLSVASMVVVMWTGVWRTIRASIYRGSLVPHTVCIEGPFGTLEGPTVYTGF